MDNSVEDINVKNRIEELIRNSNLGTKIVGISKVTGGLSHRMYKVVTDKEIYAVKKLNPGLMKREEAYSNFVFTERVIDIAKENGIPAIGAIKFGKDIMKRINGSFFMVFEWIDGKILKSEEITEKHCEILGRILSQIHNIDFSRIEDDGKKKIKTEEFEWNNYLELAKKSNKTYVDILEKNIELLQDLNKKANEANEYSKKKLVISHTDLDRKNVMWKEDKPFIIDWDASGYINPTIELIQVAWYWSGGDVQELDYNKFKIIVDSYKKHSKIEVDKNIEKLMYADIYNGLAWISYNFKRSLYIENNYEQEEIKLAENEIIQSISEINYNIKQINKITEILNLDKMG